MLTPASLAPYCGRVRLNMKNLLGAATLILLSLFSDPAHAADRVALVIGNSNYKLIGALPNPEADATAIADSLRRLGYEATLVLNTSESDMRRAVRQFASVSAYASVAVIFYAGHGTQVNGENYLLPTDMGPPAFESDIQLTGMKLDDLVNSIRAKTKIIFLDACRDNPLLIQSLASNTRGIRTRGLAPENASNLQPPTPGGGIFIAYATDSGSVAMDGQGQHSPFTKALLDHLSDRVSLDDMFAMVTKEVRNNTHEFQRPYKYASLEDIICLACSTSAELKSKTAKPVPQSTEDSASTRQSYNDWALFEWFRIDKKPVYLKPDSIKPLANGSVAVLSRLFIGASYKHPKLGGLSDGSYEDDLNVYECTEPKFRLAETNVYDEKGKLRYHYKWSDPAFIHEMIAATEIVQGSVNETARHIVCDERFRTPLLQKDEPIEKSYMSLSSTAGGDGEMYYKPGPDTTKKPSPLP